METEPGQNWWCWKCDSWGNHGAEACKVVHRPPGIVCLCGSTRFIDTMAVTAWELEKQGEIVLSCHLLPREYTTTAHHVAEEQGVGDRMDELHLRKIDLADRVFLLNVGGYIGDSTQSELAYSIATGKPVQFLEEPAGGDFMQRNAHELGQQVAAFKLLEEDRENGS